MVEKAAPLPQTQAVQENQSHRPVPHGIGRARGLCLEAGLIGQRVVATRRHSTSPPRDEPELVQANGLNRSGRILSYSAKSLLIGTARCRAGTPGGVRGEGTQVLPLSRFFRATGRAQNCPVYKTTTAAVIRAGDHNLLWFFALYFDRFSLCLWLRKSKLTASIKRWFSDSVYFAEMAYLSAI